MVATQLPSPSSDLNMANCIADACAAGKYMSSEHADISSRVLNDLFSAPVAAQQTAMESAIAQATDSIDLSSFKNISMQVDPTEVRLEVAGNNADKGRDGIA